MDGAKLRNMRLSSDMTRKEVATRAGITEHTIYLLETGKSSNPTLEVLSGLARALDCDVRDLLDEK